MIRYTLNCSNGHGFDSWFPSSAAFAEQQTAAIIACPVCGATEVKKSLMAPAVGQGQNGGPDSAPAGTGAGMPDGQRPLSRPASELEAALAAIRRQVEENSDYVGLDFVTEARRMHEGRVPERSIYGEAKVEEARKLFEDGLPVAPLPFIPGRKVN